MTDCAPLVNDLVVLIVLGTVAWCCGMGVVGAVLHWLRL